MSHSHSHSHPDTFRAAQVHTVGGKFELTDIKWRDAQEGEIVVKVIACGVCHSDVAVVYNAFGGGLPRTPGHEVTGRVHSVGPNEKRWKVNDLVGGGWHGGHCGICASCRRGDFNTCENGAINGVSQDGGYAEYAVLKSNAVVALPEGVDPYEAGPLLCAGVTVFNSLRNMDVRPGDLVAVQGIGGLGHLALQYSRAMGYRTAALSSGAGKAALAKELGADYYIDGSVSDQAAELAKLGGAKVVLATAPDATVIQKLIHGLAVNGQLVILAVSQEDLTIPTVPIITKRIRIQGWPAGTANDSEETVVFSQAKGIKPMIQKYKLEDVNEAFESMMSGKIRFRAVLAIE